MKPRSFATYQRAVAQEEPRLSSAFVCLLPDHELDRVLVTLPSEENPNGSRFGDVRWIWPEHMYPHDSLSKRSILFRTPARLASVRIDEMIRAVKRYILLCIYMPRTRRLSLPALQKRAARLIEFCAELAAEGGFEFLSSVDAATYHRVVGWIGRGRVRVRSTLVVYLDELRELGHRGLLPDYFGARGPLLPSQASSAHCDEPLAGDADDDGEAQSWLPLPDEYLAEAGKRCAFYLNEIGPNLVRLLKNHPDTTAGQRHWLPAGRSGGDPKAGSVKAARTEAWRAWLSKFDWRTSQDTRLSCIPFPCRNLVFPPKNYSDLIDLVSRHQDAALQIVLLLSGGRAKEVVSMERTIVEFTGEEARLGDDAESAQYGLISGHTMKPSERALGKPRDWPIPLQVADWLTNQAAISAAIATDSSAYLWIALRYKKPQGHRITPHHRCTAFARRHGLEHLLGPEGGNPHPHRFRKSIARIALLALTGAPIIIMQMFGHRDLTSTLHYLLSDPCIRDDIRVMLGERRSEVALNIVECLDESAGPAASVLRDVRDAFFDELHVPKNERSQRIRLSQFAAAKLADGSVDFKIVYPGVICIKALEQKGLCVEPGREPNPSKCQTPCQHRLELPLRKHEVHAIICQLLDDLDDVNVKRSIDLSIWYTAAVIDHLAIFADVKESFRYEPRLEKLLGRFL